MAVPYTFANSTSAIPLSQLDNNFATAVTIGNTAVQLGNTVTTLNNMTMANVTISSVSTPITAAQGGTGLSAVGSSGNLLTSNGTAWVSQAPAAATGNVTIGNTTINLGGTATTVGNLTLTNATISSVSTPITVAQGGTGLTTLTSNNVLIGNGAGSVTFVAPGTSGNVLASNGTAWVSQAAGGSGSWVYLSTVTASNAATVSVETTFDSTYDVYALTISGVYSDVFNDTFRAILKVGGVYQTSNYSYNFSNPGSNNSTTYVGKGGTSTYIFINDSQTSNTAARTCDFVMFIHEPASTSVIKKVHWRGDMISAANNTIQLSGAGAYYASGTPTTTAMTGIRFSMVSGNTTGTFRLYGIKNS